MGEIISGLGQIEFSGQLVEVEVNAGFSEGGTREVHLQTPTSRVEMTFDEFLILLFSLKKASFDLRTYKDV